MLLCYHRQNVTLGKMLLGKLELGKKLLRQNVTRQIVTWQNVAEPIDKWLYGQVDR